MPLWPLALLAGLLPAVAALVAWGLSTQLGLIPACNPFFDGCVSISRAARHDLPNHVFRALVLPAATLQGLVWLLAARWLRDAFGGARPPPGARAPAPRGLRWIAPLGAAAAVALVLYGAFLGTEGQAYRWLRQYGTVVYFGATCICLLLVGDAVQRHGRDPAAGGWRLPPLLERAMLALGWLLVALALANAYVAALVGEPWKGRIENVTEWWGALIFVLGFVALAAMWRRLGLRLALR